MKGKILENLEIIDIADDGKSLAKHNGLVIFADKAMPGDVVDVMITRKHRSYLEGTVVKVHTSSPYRVQPFCKHFGTCGGCKWQDMDYEIQLRFKQKQVKDAMERLGNLKDLLLLPIKGSVITRYYRNKLDYSFSDKKWLVKNEFESLDDNKGPALGYHIPGRFDKVLDVQECYLQPDPSDAIRNFIKSYALEHHLTFINLRHREGLLRSLIIRSSLIGELMVIVMVYEDHREQLLDLLTAVSDNFPMITSLLYIINPKANDTFHDLPVHNFKGKDYIEESLEGLKYRIGPKSFFQTNPSQTLELYRITREFAGLSGNELVYDLYTGTGTIACFVASSCKKVVGIEYVPEAIADAGINARLNNITNTVFYAGDMKDLLNTEMYEKEGKPDVIITDPPRSGMHYDVVDAILKSGASRIVYVSCNPSTQARDINLLSERYDVIKLQPVDMFPHTAHVENVALMELKKNL